MEMPAELRGPGFHLQYTLVDIRDLDSEKLLQSAEIGDNLIAILTTLRDQGSAIRRIMSRVGGLTGARGEAVQLLLRLAVLRRLDEAVEEEREKMPIIIDISESAVLGPPYRRGLAEGEAVGERKLLRRLIVKRFGAMPAGAEERLNAMSIAELEQIGERVLDATTIEELLP